jgi:phage terminase large subunit
MEPGKTVDIPANEKQRQALIAWLDDLVDDVVYGGAAGGGKSFLAGLALTILALKYPGAKLFLGRKELKTLMLTSYITLTQKVFPVFGLEHDKDWKLDGKYNVIHFTNGSTINLLDLAYTPADPLYDRFGSHEYTAGWIEEASEVDFKAYDVLKSRVGRHNDFVIDDKPVKVKSKLGLSLNPSQEWPYRLFYSPWKKAGKPSTPLVSVSSMVEGRAIERTFLFIQALYKDNPFTAGEYMKNLATIVDPVMKQRLMDGDWEYSSAHDTLFPAQVIADLYTNRLKPSEDYFLVVDIARTTDRIVRTVYRGWDAVQIRWKVNVPITETVDDVRTDADRYGIPRNRILYDADGVGLTFGDLLPGAIGFHGGSAPFGRVGEKEVRENYENLKAQCAYHLSEKAKNREVAVSEQDIEIRELLSQELSQIKRRDVEKDGRLKISKKEDMIGALGRSPDIADTLIMRSYFDLRERDVDLGWMNQTITVSTPDY